MSWRDQLQQLRQSAPAEITAFLAAESAANNQDLDLHFERARHAQAQQQYIQAIGAFLPVSLAPGDRQAVACLHLGECFEQIGDATGARLAYEKASEIDPGNQWPVSHLAHLVSRESGAETAIPLLRAAIPNLRPDGKAAIIRLLADVMAEQTYDAERPDPSWRIARDITLPALHDAVMIMLVKDEADIIGQNLRHHFALGFRRFCILDNASTDGTQAAIAAFRAATPGARVLSLNDPIIGYYQADKMAAAERLCEVYMAIEGPAPSWFFFIDADEFITFAGTGNLAAGAAQLNTALSVRTKNLLIMHWVHSASRAIYRNLPSDADPFQSFSQFCPVLTPAVPKVAYRAGIGLHLMAGNHFVAEYDRGAEEVIFGGECSLFLFHFPLRSVEHVLRKVINGGKAYAAAQGLDDHGGHWRKRYELYQKHGDQMIIHILATYIRETSEGKLK
jgi:hypothetical protein